MEVDACSRSCASFGAERGGSPQRANLIFHSCKLPSVMLRQPSWLRRFLGAQEALQAFRPARACFECFQNQGEVGGLGR